jgi:alpha-amylase/alpha-mannosidase (GH57 family)
MIKKYICIHGHFYQPPRENAWLNEIQSQPSAAPFTNWNERICYECYAPNSAARILDSNQKILKIVNNYEKISFNIGPTLMSWLEEHQSSVYKEIIEADKLSVKANNGHGNAIAQIYNHLIMPLANDLEKEIQVHWGIKDFEFRYGRKPEGMWLSETAVNTSTLQYLSEAGILFTILAPRQIESIRNPSGEWIPFDESSIDTHQSYKVILPNGQVYCRFLLQWRNFTKSCI